MCFLFPYTTPTLHVHFLQALVRSFLPVIESLGDDAFRGVGRTAAMKRLRYTQLQAPLIKSNTLSFSRSTNDREGTSIVYNVVNLQIIAPKIKPYGSGGQNNNSTSNSSETDAVSAAATTNAAPVFRNSIVGQIRGSEYVSYHRTISTQWPGLREKQPMDLQHISSVPNAVHIAMVLRVIKGDEARSEATREQARLAVQELNDGKLQLVLLENVGLCSPL